MRENTAKTTATTFNLSRILFPDVDAETAAELEAPYVWEGEAGARTAISRLDRHSDLHTVHTAPGLEVHAFYTRSYQTGENELYTVIVIEDADLARVHTAIRTGRELSLRYVKADGTVTRRRTQPQSLSFTKAGDVLLRAADDRRDGETRSFRWDRVTATTLHRSVRRAAPTKSALWAEFERTLAAAAPAEEMVEVQAWDGASKLITRTEYDSLLAARDPREPKAVDEALPVTGQVRHARHGYTGVVVEGTRAYGAGGWSVLVKLDSDHAHLAVGGTTRASESELEAWVTIVTDVYSTEPGTAAALEAPEAVQQVLAERWATGHRYAFLTA